MTTEQRIKDRNIGIIGMARSGIAAAVLAESLGGKPFVSDSKNADLLKTEIERLNTAGIPYEAGGHSERLFASDYLVVSPGVPLTLPIIKEAREKGIPVFSEIEFASWCCKGKIIAITGSNGKTTTTTLIGEIFATAGFDTFVCGNIGFPFAEIVPKIPEQGIAIVEVSNFQLETISDFKPKAALILNLTPDHLDRHGTFENYIKAKLRITENQSDTDCLILNFDDKVTSQQRIESNAEVRYFSTGVNAKSDTTVSENILFYRGEKIIDTDEIMLPGPHNLQNVCAAVIAAKLFDISTDDIVKVLKSFAGVEHRMENVGSIAGITFINDSKATNVDSVCYALRSVKTDLYLIAGGRDKNSDFSPLINFGKNKIKSIIAIGEAKEKLFKTLGNSFPVLFADSLEEAVGKSFELATPGETIMLSPGCASFDMFDNFEHRGRVFKNAVADLKNGKNKNETINQK